MKIIRFVAFLFYNYYSTGSRASIKYFSTLIVLTGLCFIHLLQLVIFLNKIEIISIQLPSEKAVRYISIAIIGAPIYFLLNFILQEKDLIKLKEYYDYNWDKVFNGNVLLVTYMILSFALLTFLILWKT